MHRLNRATAVIGANFGDEGKGLITDYLAASCPNEVVVVRFNGGAQAAHTVQTPAGVRHVFSHFGSGTLTDSSTFLSEYVICDPIQFYTEHQTLTGLGHKPVVSVDPSARVATPYDLVINRVLEAQRLDKKHGSCGLGIGETVERNQHADAALSVGDLRHKPTLTAILRKIQRNWVPRRLEALGISVVPPLWQDWLTAEEVFQKYIHRVEYFLDNVHIMPIHALPTHVDCIFEGAQGLWLDQTRGWFPHVTRSNTGCTNIVPLLKALGYHGLDLYYVSRAYLTRHGRGPLPNELPSKPYDGIVDLTNIANPHQDALRYAYLNLPLLQQAIQTDLASLSNAKTIDYRFGLAVTCFDQVGSEFSYFTNPEQLSTSNQRAFLNALTTDFSLPVWLTSSGPTRADVTRHNTAEMLPSRGY